MKKHLFNVLTIALSLFYVGVMSLEAATVSADQAKQIAVRFLTDQQQAQHPGVQPLIKKGALRPNELETSVVFNATDNDGAPYLYAVQMSSEGGYVIVSGDDSFTEVLGYSDASFDEQQMPDNMRAMLEMYIEEMNYLRAIDYTPTLRQTEETKSAISEMLTTKWGQGSPFNMYCPQDGSNLSITGCVATAMAQVINYHIQNYNAPTSIVQAIDGYTTEMKGFVLQGISAGTPLPNKNLLLDSYSSSNTNITEAQKSAVAQLSYYCGVSVQMDYSSRSSGASSSYVPAALINNFGFDATTRMVSRSNYAYAAWMDLIYAELAANRPVYYRGGSSGGGHAFVVDGYDGNGLFHVNWGWTGNSNGYFALSVLNSDDDGQLGASNSWDGYNIGQQAIIGIQINTGQTFQEPICLTSGINSIEERTISFRAYNYTGVTRVFEYGIGIVQNDGTLTPISDIRTTASLDNRYGYSSLNFTVPINTDYANTTQKITFISREENTGTWYAGANTDIYYVSVSYNTYGVPNALAIHPSHDLAVTNMHVPTSKFVTDKQTVSFTLTNNGDEFYGTLYLFDGTMENGEETPVTYFGLTALSGETTTILIPWAPTETGTYNLRLATDKYGENIIASTNVTITEDASLTGRTLVITGLTLKGLDVLSFQLSAEGTRSYDINNDSIVGQVHIKNISSNTFTNLRVQVKIEQYNEQTQQFEPDSYTGTYSWSSYSSGASTNLNIKRGTFQRGKTYRIALVERGSSASQYSNYFDDRYIVHLLDNETPDPGPNTAVETVPQDTNIGQKLFENGQIIILKNGVRYNVQGQVIR